MRVSAPRPPRLVAVFAKDEVGALGERVKASPGLLSALEDEAAPGDPVRLEGTPVMEAAVAPIRFAANAPPAFRSMDLTDNQKQMNTLKKRALEAGVRLEHP